MQILLAFIAGAVIGIAAHFVVAARQTRGAALLPVLGALSSGLAWMILTWAGVGIDNIVLWLAALAAPAVVTFPVGLLLTRARLAHDARERTRLQIS